MPERDEIALFARRLNALGAEYMIPGATAAILYGQPRVTNDLDLVIALDEDSLAPLFAQFPDDAFYLPPESAVRAEQGRPRGHFNILHLESGYKADVYLAGSDPFHAWAFARRRTFHWTSDLALPVAPPEYVIVRKLEYYREGGSTKHPADIRAIIASTAVDRAAVTEWSERLGLGAEWSRF